MNDYFRNIGGPEKCILNNATYLENEIFKKFADQNQIIIFVVSDPELYIQEILKQMKELTNSLIIFDKKKNPRENCRCETRTTKRLRSK